MSCDIVEMCQWVNSLPKHDFIINWAIVYVAYMQPDDVKSSIFISV